jgi:RNA polymerase sigma factor for flagellar operon FliA
MPRLKEPPRAPVSEQRDHMVEAHLGLVHFIARQLANGMRADIEFDELVSAGTLGLIAAVESFDASRGLAFSTFATPRVRGAMIDELRRQDHVPRSVRRKARDLRAAHEQLGGASGARPSDDDTAALLGIDVRTLWRWEADAEGSVLVPLDTTPADDTGGVSEAELLGGISDDDVEQRVGVAHEIDHMRDAILALKEQERLVLALYFYEDLKLHEIAMALGVTESRVSQIRTRALASLRGKLISMRADTL